MALRVITQPTKEPVTVDEALKQCLIDHTDDNAYIGRLITAGRRRIEKRLRRALMRQTLRLSLDRFPCGEIRLPKPPAIEIDSITYRDTQGELQELEDYQFDDESEPARLLPAYGEVWPDTRCQVNAVKIEWKAGVVSAAEVPQEIKLAILMLVAHWYLHRESVTEEGKLSETPQSIDFLLSDERVFRFG